MKTVRIISNWDYPDITRQTPGGRGIWQGIKFTTKDISECDYVIVSNYSNKDIGIKTFPENVWCIQQEPHNEYFAVRHKYASQIYSRVFTTDPSLKESRFIHSHGCIPWHINKSYDQLKTIEFPDKNRDLSCIVSSKANFAGQRKRLRFIQDLKKRLHFDHFGFGFNPVSDKWDALAPFKYSLVLENFSSAHYWSEKIADCFLSWTMPIYYGCTGITDYFPKESMIIIDINDPDAAGKIVGAIKSDLWKKNMDAVAFARNLILDRYQFFPYFAGEIHNWEKNHKFVKRKKEMVIIPNENSRANNLFLNLLRIRGKLLHEN